MAVRSISLRMKIGSFQNPVVCMEKPQQRLGQIPFMGRSTKQHQVGICKEIGAAVADQNVVKILLPYQLGYTLAVIAQVNQYHLTIAFCQKASQTITVGVPNHQKFSRLLGILDADEGMVPIQKYGIFVGPCQPFQIEGSLVDILALVTVRPSQPCQSSMVSGFVNHRALRE